MWFHRSFESRSWSRKPRLCWCPQKVVWRPAAIVWRNWFITGGLSIGHYGCIFELNRCTTCKWTASAILKCMKINGEDSSPQRVACLNVVQMVEQTSTYQGGVPWLDSSPTTPWPMTANQMQYMKTQNSFWRQSFFFVTLFLRVFLLLNYVMYKPLENEELEPEILTAWKVFFFLTSRLFSKKDFPPPVIFYSYFA